MGENKMPNTPESSVESARTGYQVAVNLWTSQAEQVWANFNVMVLANSIIIGGIALLLSGSVKLGIFSLALPSAGLLLCVLWLLLVTRGLEYQNYYVSSARELEEQHLNSPLTVVSRGERFANGKTVRFETKESGGRASYRELQMSCLARFRAKWAFYLLIVLVFGGIYTVVLVELATSRVGS